MYSALFPANVPPS